MKYTVTNIYEFIGTKLRPVELAEIVKRVLRIKRRYYHINNNYWFLDPISNFGLRLLRYGYYEPEMTHLILNNLEEDDIFIDLGANEGYFSILASKVVGKNGKVYCIEPQNRLLDIISKNINKNNCYNINIIPYAISDIKSEVSITLSPSINTGSSTLVNENRRKFWKKQTLNSTTLDELLLLKALPSIRLMKIDIEGYELFALKGATGLLQMNIIKNIIIEFHPHQLKAMEQSVQQIHDFLEKFGYSEVNGVFRLNLDK